MGEHGQWVRFEGIRTEPLARWASGDPHVWTRRTISVERLVDTRFVVTFDGQTDFRGGSYAYDDKGTAWRSIQWMMATPDAIGNYPGWERLEPGGAGPSTALPGDTTAPGHR